MSETETDAPPATLRGRFALFGDSPMTYVIAYATDLCDRCQECGCGSQQEPIHTAAVVKQMLNPGNLKQAIRMFRRQQEGDGGD